MDTEKVKGSLRNIGVLVLFQVSHLMEQETGAS